MRRLICLLALVLVATLSAAAQDAPKAEVFGGYSYLRVNPGGGAPGINLNGWNASVAGNVNNWFGIVGEFSGAYGTPNIGGLDVKTNAHTFLFGPRISSRNNDRLTPFAHALFGAARIEGSSLGVNVSDSAFSMALGGGVDWKANDHLAIRLAQGDYLLTRFGGSSQHNFRLSTGVVFRFGGR